MEKACLTYASWTLPNLAATLYPLPSMSQKPSGSFSLLVIYQLLHHWPTQATYLCLNTKSKIAYITAALVTPVYLSAHHALQVRNDCNIIMVPSNPPIIDDFRHCQSCPSRYIWQGPYQHRLQNRGRGNGPKDICKEYSGHLEGEKCSEKNLTGGQMPELQIYWEMHS